MAEIAIDPSKKRRLPTVRVETRTEKIARVSAELKTLDAERTAARIGVRDLDRALKSTVSLCPECLAHVPALVFERAGRVIIGKHCAEHGSSEALLESYAGYYALSNKDTHGRRFAGGREMHIPAYVAGASCCGPGESCGTGDGTDQMTNRTCTVLVEITDACNLSCRVCYSESAGEHYLPVDDLRATLRALIDKKGQLDSVQITGGEATMHPKFWEIVTWVHAQPEIKKLYVPTNGLRLVRDEELARFVPLADKLVVLLQFDSLDRDANQTMRRAEPADLRRGIVERLERLGVAMQLTMTVSVGVNDEHVGEVLDVALAHDNVKVVALQPATWSGRYELDRDPMHRTTLSDVAEAVMRSARVRMRRQDFVPIPCSHPNCGWISVFLRRFGLVHNIVRYVDLERAMNQVAYKTLLSTDELRSIVGTADRDVLSRIAGFLGKRVVRSTDMFSIAVKPFMDRYTYDQDRIASCCHHITDTRGGLHSFCEYNALDRRADDWSRLPLRQAVT